MTELSVLAVRDSTALLSCQAAPSEPLPEIPDGASFVCLLWCHEPLSDPVFEAQLLHLLCRESCEYVLCAGPGAERLSERVADALRDRHGLADSGLGIDSDEAPEEFASWLSNETPQDTLLYFLNSSLEDPDDANFLVLHLGGAGARPELDALAALLFEEQ